jgi:hypothetical protein
MTERHPRIDPRSDFSFGPNLETATQQAHAFAHAGEAESRSFTRLMSVEAIAVVDEFQAKAPVCFVQHHFHLISVAMLHYVTECFLKQAKEVEFDIGIQAPRNCHASVNHLDPVLLGEIPAQTLDSGSQSQKLQLRGMELMREGADPMPERSDLILKLLQLSVTLFRRTLQKKSRSPQFCAEEGDRLPDVIVKFSRNPSTLFLLCVQEQASHFCLCRTRIPE